MQKIVWKLFGVHRIKRKLPQIVAPSSENSYPEGGNSTVQPQRPMTTSPALEELRAAVERDADRLVTELFADFEVGEAAADRMAEPAPLALREPQELLVLSDAAVEADWDDRSPAARRGWERWFFLGAAGLLLGSLFWSWRIFWRPSPVQLPVAPVASDERAQGNRDRQEFIAYLQKTLAAIERDERHARQIAAAKAERERAAAAQAEEAAALPEPPPQIIIPAPPQIPLPTSLPDIAIPVPPPPVPLATTVVPKTAPVPAPAKPAAPSEPPAPVEPPTVAANPSVPNGPALEILGSLEIGNLALALIEIDGKTERVAVGENIPGTGWSVATIAPRQVVLRDRSGRERTVPVGGRL